MIQDLRMNKLDEYRAGLLTESQARLQGHNKCFHSLTLKKR